VLISISVVVLWGGKLLRVLGKERVGSGPQTCGEGLFGLRLLFSLLSFVYALEKALCAIGL
jgi:hypothetical protein